MLSLKSPLSYGWKRRRAPSSWMISSAKSKSSPIKSGSNAFQEGTLYARLETLGMGRFSEMSAMTWSAVPTLLWAGGSGGSPPESQIFSAASSSGCHVLLHYKYQQYSRRCGKENLHFWAGENIKVDEEESDHASRNGGGFFKVFFLKACAQCTFTNKEWGQSTTKRTNGWK